MKNKFAVLLLTTLLIIAGITVLASVNSTQAMPLAPTLDPKMIPKFVNQLPIPPVYEPTVITNATGHVIRHEYTVNVTEFYQQILPTVDKKGKPTGFPATKVWGYEGFVNIGGSIVPFRFSPGATFEATRGIPIQVKWVNNLVGATGQPLSHMFPVDPTLHWANPNNMSMMPPMPWPQYPPGFPDAQTPVPIVTHLHGGEVPSGSDGGPEQWWTADGIQKGPDYRTTIPTDANAAVYYYPNEQLPTTLWYHDHALGVTRINVMSGLAGFYLLRDTADPIAPYLPSGSYEVPIVIQDRSFNLDGSFWFPPVGLDPMVHPYWQPEFFGDVIMVNSAVWPNLNIEPRQYRFRLLDGSNARFYSLSFVDQVTGALLPFTQIGSDGGYLPMPVPLTSLTIAPGERADILVDFSGLPAGTKVLVKNNAKAPFPGGAPAKGSTVGQIMQFTVSGAPVPPTPLPTPWPITMPTFTPDTAARQLTLIEVMGALGPTEILLDGQKWAAPTSENFTVGSTVDWVIVNPTADTHPIHLHLVQFQVVSRQRFDVNAYMTAWMAANGMPPLNHPTINIPLAPYLKGRVMAPPPNEMGWKDTVQMNPGEVTVIRVRYAPQDAVITTPGLNLFAFDPWVGPGYVWHCHILDHEDNEMMRRQIVLPPPP